jgi:NTE family protein
VRLFARTLHRQLRAAHYDRAEIVALVNELLGLVVAGATDEPLSGVTDVETSLPNEDVFLDALAFEMSRAREAGGRLLLLALDVEPPDWCPDEAAWTLHARVAGWLRRGVRPADVVARLSTTRYGIVLPGASRADVQAIARRLVQPIVAPRRQEDAPPEGTRVYARFLEHDPTEESASAMLAKCSAEHAEEIRPSVQQARHSEPPRAPVTAGSGFVLAFGGGAARAAAHIGVLRVLERERTPIRGIAGTSAGALVGAMALIGMSAEEILARFQAFTHSPIYAKLRRQYVLYRRGARRRDGAPRQRAQDGAALLSNTSVAAIDDALYGEFIAYFVGVERDVSTLRAPFAAAATDLSSGRPVWITRGPLHFALRASCAVPGLFPPQRDGDRVLVDGSVLAEVPVAAARSLVAGSAVLAVHLARPERRLAHLESSAQIVVRAGAMAHKELVREQLRDAALLLTAHVEEIGWLDFRNAERTAAVGEAAMERLVRRHR